MNPPYPISKDSAMSAPRRTIAVALHDIEPATFERCALIRDWLDDHGVDHVTLLVIPARDLHPLAERSPEMVSWLIERERGGDAIAQPASNTCAQGHAGAALTERCAPSTATTKVSSSGSTRTRRVAQLTPAGV